MYVGVARIVLHIPGSASLKARRKVVKSFKDRLRARLPVSVAEVGDTEKYQVGTLGVCVVSADAHICEEVLDQARSWASNLSDALLADAAIEVMSFGRGGGGVRGGIEHALDQKTEGTADERPEGDWDDDTLVDTPRGNE